jgi:hypothetical protein
MTWQLLPGLRLVRREAGWLQLGIDPPLRAVLPDRAGVRRLVRELADGRPISTLDDDGAAALAAVVRAGLAEPAEEPASRRARRAGALVHLDAPAELVPPLLRLVEESGMAAVVGVDPRPVTMALVWGAGEVARERVDGWVRSGTPHLVVAERPDGTWLGPYVVPDVTACLRCVDAHRGELDPRRPLVVEQHAGDPPLAGPGTDATVRAMALAWAVRDLARAAEGGRPATWSAQVQLDPAGQEGTAAPRVTPYARHPHCGCTWAEPLRPVTRRPAVEHTVEHTDGDAGVARAG